jgi:hypothetical protein
MMRHFVQAVSAGFNSNRSDVTYRAEQAARQLYQRAYILGWLGRLWTALTGQSPYLLNLTEVEAAARNRYSAGLQEVPIDRIRGSQGRCPDFDRNFYPLQDHLKSRWLRVATARQLGQALPPVELIQVGDIYFVRDGHHRISVARALGQLEINAEVRVWQALTHELEAS